MTTTYKHVYTNVFRELKSRIETAKTGKLKELKTLKIGRIQETYNIKEMPRINMYFDGFSEGYEAQKNQNKKADIRLIFHLVYPLPNNKALDNIYYNDDNDLYTGFIPFIEAFLDVIHSDTSGSIDPRINSTARRSFNVESDRPGKGENYLDLPIMVSVRTQDFKINERYTATS